MADARAIFAHTTVGTHQRVMSITVPPDPKTSDGYAMRILRVVLPPRWTFTIDESDYEEARFRAYACERGLVPVCRPGYPSSVGTG